MATKLKYEVIAVNDIEVLADVSLLQKTDDLYFNATLIAKQFGKQSADWLKTDQAQEYCKLISQKENIRFENLVRVTKGGKYKGTWLHKTLALCFARWCSVEFEYNLDKWINRRLTEEHLHQQNRLKLKTGFLPLTNAIQTAHTDLKPYHFRNECDLINRLVTGLSAKQFKLTNGVDNVRDSLTFEQSQLMDRLQTQNTSLIELGFSYGNRKLLLTKHVHKLDSFMKAVA